MDQVNLIIGLNLVTLVSVVTYGYKILRFINRIEFKVDLMWKDFERRSYPRFETDIQGNKLEED